MLWVALLLLAWGVRATAVGAHRLHPDEALYGYWGLLILSGRDPWLVSVPVYKPPLLPYLMAGSLALVGRSELAVRLPGLAAGLATVGLMGRLGRRLYGASLVGLVAAAVVALSPLSFLLSATGFTDPLMVALGVAGCVAAAEGRAGQAGVFTGLSFATKQTGLVWLPPVALLVVASGGRKAATRLMRGVVGFLAVAGLVAGWDRVRVAQGAESFWQAGVVGYGGLRLIWPMEWSGRLAAWMGWLQYLLGSALPDGLLVVGGAALVVRGIRRRDWPALFDLALAGFCLLYLLVHWLWAFPVWDRYLLPLVVPAGLLLGRVVVEAARLMGAGLRHPYPPPGSPQAGRDREGGEGRGAPPSSQRRLRIALSLVTAACLVAATFPALAGRVPVGAGLPAYDGIEQVAAFLMERSEGSVLYHHWLGWNYHFYLFDGPLYLAYWPTPAWLARDVQAFGEREPRYIVFPAWESPARVEAALAEVGYRLEPVFVVEEGGERQFVVYQVSVMRDT